MTVGKLDCTQSNALCQDNDVKGYPTLAYYRNGKKLETYRGARYVLITRTHTSAAVAKRLQLRLRTH